MLFLVVLHHLKEKIDHDLIGNKHGIIKNTFTKSVVKTMTKTKKKLISFFYNILTKINPSLGIQITQTPHQHYNADFYQRY